MSLVRPFILIVTTFLILSQCEGYSGVINPSNQQEPAQFLGKTYGKEDEEGIRWRVWEDLDYTAVSIVLWPVILILISAIVIPTALVMVVIFVIPVITPYGGGEGERRGFSSTIWNSIFMSQGAVEGAEECVERISCELAKVANKYSYPLANRIQDKITHASVLSSATKSRLSRSFEVAAGLGRSEGCQKFKCEPLESMSSSNLFGLSNASISLGKIFGMYFNSNNRDLNTTLSHFLSSLGNRLVFRKKNKLKGQQRVVRLK